MEQIINRTPAGRSERNPRVVGEGHPTSNGGLSREGERHSRKDKRSQGRPFKKDRSAGKAIQEIGADVDTAMSARKEAMETKMEASIKSC
jgi:hypothetical protein